MVGLNETPAQQLYRVLTLMPCACTHKWNHNDQELVHKCVRCVALERWEKEGRSDVR